MSLCNIYISDPINICGLFLSENLQLLLLLIPYIEYCLAACHLYRSAWLMQGALLRF